MKKGIRLLLARLCYLLGVLGALYFGGIVMLIHPLEAIYEAYVAGALTAWVLLVSLIRMALSATIGGLVWCIGYIGCNYFKGDEDPDWDAINARIRQQKETAGTKTREKGGYGLFKTEK